MSSPQPNDPIAAMGEALQAQIRTLQDQLLTRIRQTQADTAAAIAQSGLGAAAAPAPPSPPADALAPLVKALLADPTFQKGVQALAGGKSPSA